MKKVDLDTAATYFGISPDAVRKRIKRGKVDSVKESGRLYVLIPDNGSENIGQIADNTGQLVQALEKHIETLKQEIERKQQTIDALQKNQEQVNYILALKEQKILELEAPDRRPWWRKLFKREGGS